jgi:hypothetical protein
MKKISLSILFVSIHFACKIFAQDTTSKKGWPSSERYTFIAECVKTAKVGMSDDSARSYCYCMQEKIEKKYPTTDAAAKLSSADLETTEWKKEIQNCLAPASTWSTKDRSDFLSECVKSAKEKVSEEKSKNYCECMLFKVEKKYPNPLDAGKITEETLSSPDWKKMIADCFAF